MSKTFRKIKVNRVGLIEYQLMWTLARFDYNKKDLTYLAYIYLYGPDARDRMVLDRLSKSRGSVDNYISKYRLDGVVVGVGREIKLNPEIKLVSESFEQTIQFELDDNSTQG